MHSKRPLLNLLLCLTASALWARSYFLADALTHQSGNYTTCIFSHGGTCVLYIAGSAGGAKR